MRDPCNIHSNMTIMPNLWLKYHFHVMQRPTSLPDSKLMDKRLKDFTNLIFDNETGFMPGYANAIVAHTYKMAINQL